MKKLKNLLIAGMFILVILMIIWAFIPDFLFDVNIHATYYLFGMDVVVLAYVSLFLLMYLSIWLVSRIRKTSF